MSLTLGSIDPARRDDMALTDERVTYSWNQLDPILNRAANGMAFAVDGTRRAGVFAPNSAEAVIAYVAGLEAGVSTVPISYHLTAGEVSYILRDSRASVLFVGPETAEAGLAAATEVGIGTVIGWRCPPTPGLIDWEEWLAESSSQETADEHLGTPDRRDPAALRMRNPPGDGQAEHGG